MAIGTCDYCGIYGGHKSNCELIEAQLHNEYVNDLEEAYLNLEEENNALAQNNFELVKYNQQLKVEIRNLKAKLRGRHCL